MKKMLFTVLAGVLALGITQADAKEWKKVRIGTEGAYAPFNFVDSSGKLAGFEVEYAEALCKEMKVECTLVQQDWDGIIPALQAKKFDAIMASMSITDERRKTIEFSAPYYNSPSHFLARKDTPLKMTAEGLKGKIIGVQRATIQDNYATEKFASVAEIKRYTTADEAYLDLGNNRLDVMLVDAPAAFGGFLQKPEGKDFAFIGAEIPIGGGVGVGLRKADKDLKEMFDKAIAATYANGTFKKLNDKYFPFDLSIKQ